MTPRAAILTISDRCASGQSQDAAGPPLADAATRLLSAQIVIARCIPDEADQIAATLREWASAPNPPHLILTTGGTGLAPRDVTPEATQSVLDRPHPGLMEFVRARCGQHFPHAYLSRGLAGTINNSLVINLPGSPRGALESFEVLAEILPHALAVLADKTEPHPAPSDPAR
jgi:molybdenum cofactor synthesis domain-containing protein